MLKPNDIFDGNIRREGEILPLEYYKRHMYEYEPVTSADGVYLRYIVYVTWSDYVAIAPKMKARWLKEGS